MILDVYSGRWTGKFVAVVLEFAASRAYVVESGGKRFGSGEWQNSSSVSLAFEIRTDHTSGKHFVQITAGVPRRRRSMSSRRRTMPSWSVIRDGQRNSQAVSGNRTSTTRRPSAPGRSASLRRRVGHEPGDPGGDRACWVGSRNQPGTLQSGPALARAAVSRRRAIRLSAPTAASYERVTTARPFKGTSPRRL